MQVNEQGWLENSASGEPLVKRYPTPRTSRLDTKDQKPVGVIWHWTAGNGTTARWAENLALSITRRPGVGQAQASWSLLIGKDGTVYQAAPFGVGTWHVGKAGTVAGQRWRNVNRATVGIELMNSGRLKELSGKFYCWPFTSTTGAPDHRYEVAADRVVKSDGWGPVEGGYFDKFTAEQEEAAAVVLGVIVARYGVLRADAQLGHLDFDYPRKEDPGPLWKRDHLPRILARAFPGG